LSAIVPVTDILSSWKTGFGTYGEKEVVVLGSTKVAARAYNTKVFNKKYKNSGDDW
jgi:hypothetical protein